MGRLKAGEEEGTKDELVGWGHLPDGHKFEQAPGTGDGQEGLVCYSPWGCKELYNTEQFNNNNNSIDTKVLLVMRLWFFQ